MSTHWLLIGHAAATWALVGLIWMVHFVHYPLLAEGGAGFRRIHTFHMDRMGLVVGPLMLVELATALLLWASPPAGTDTRLWLVGVALIGVIWLETGLFAVPQHGRLAAGGFDPATFRSLMLGDLVRTFAWTVRGVLVAWILVRSLGVHAT